MRRYFPHAGPRGAARPHLWVVVTQPDPESHQILELEARAREAGLSVNSYVRSRLRLMERNVGKLSDDERHREEEDAWERLERLGLNPRDYLPDY